MKSLIGLSRITAPLISLFRKTIFRGPLTISFLAVIAGCVMFISGVSFFDIIELKTIDLRFDLRGALSPGNEVVLVTIDEKSLEKEGQWP